MGCAWQGAGGKVLGMDGQEATTRYQVRVRSADAGFEGIAQTGSNSFYGLMSGWEIPIATTISAGTYYVRLETTFGTALSDYFPFTFPGDCGQNLARVQFIQTSPIGSSQ